jgi:putative hydrolase of the HAD superfamily
MIIGFDADDTLWHNEDGFQATTRTFEDLLDAWAEPDEVGDRLFAIEKRNMNRYGYGVKAFTLSMIEAAIDISDGNIDTAELQTILELGHHLLDRPAELIDDVVHVLEAVGRDHTLMIITKGDLYHQLARIDSSGLKDHFWRTEVVAHKDPTTYRELLGLHGVLPGEFVMIGNSLPSDVLPVIEIGGRGIHIPYHVTWAMEHADPSAADSHDAPTLDSLADLPAFLADWV